ncbi:MAG: hypothetical protein ACYDBB_10105 [Armatimonadota bacterium]
MARVVMTLLGLVILALGVWAIIVWTPEVLVLLKGAVAVAAVLIGLALLIFGISEITGARAAKSPSPPPPPAQEEEDEDEN